MKFYKLVKSIDFVTYPVLIELQKINEVLGDSISNFRKMIISAAVGMLFDLTPISSLIIENIFCNSKISWLSSFAKINNSDTFVAFIIALIFYFVLVLFNYFSKRWGSNKNTTKERTQIVLKFYTVVIPQLISIKSIIEQHDESFAHDKDKRYLLLLQAKYEICELINILSELNVIEIDKKGLLTKNSKDVLDQIGPNAYFTILIHVLNRAKDIYKRLISCNINHDAAIIESLAATLLTARLFIICKKICDSFSLCKHMVAEFDSLKNKITNAATAFEI